MTCPIAVGVLIATGQVARRAWDGAMMVDELSLDGRVRHARGVLAVAATGAATGLPAHLRPRRRCRRSRPHPLAGGDPGATLAALHAHLEGR